MAFVFGASFLGLDADLSLTVSLFFFLSMAITSLSGLFFFFFPSFLQMDETEQVPALSDSLEIIETKLEN
jgi:hypothetical protein